MITAPKIVGIVVGCVVAVLAIWLLEQLVPAPACRDGWASHAIGIRGACSHHGGVERHGLLGLLAFLGGALVGVVAGILGYKTTEKLPQPMAMVRTPYGSLREYERHLRTIGVDEAQIRAELRKYGARA